MGRGGARSEVSARREGGVMLDLFASIGAVLHRAFQQDPQRVDAGVEMPSCSRTPRKRMEKQSGGGRIEFRERFSSVPRVPKIIWKSAARLRADVSEEQIMSRFYNSSGLRRRFDGSKNLLYRN